MPELKHTFLLPILSILLGQLSNEIESSDQCGEISLVGNPTTSWRYTKKLKDGEEILDWDPLVHGYDQEGQENYISVTTFSLNCKIQICIDISTGMSYLLPACSSFTEEYMDFLNTSPGYDFTGARCTCQSNSSFACWKRTDSCPAQLPLAESCRLYEGRNCDTCKQGYTVMFNGTRFSPGYQFRSVMLQPSCQLIYEWNNANVREVYRESTGSITERWKIRSNESSITCQCGKPTDTTEYTSTAEPTIVEPSTSESTEPTSITASTLDNSSDFFLPTETPPEATSLAMVMQTEGKIPTEQTTSLPYFGGALGAVVFLAVLLAFVDRKYNFFKRLLVSLSNKKIPNITIELTELPDLDNRNSIETQESVLLVSTESLYLDQLFSESLVGQEVLSIENPLETTDCPNIEISLEIPETQNTEESFDIPEVPNIENSLDIPTEVFNIENSLEIPTEVPNIENSLEITTAVPNIENQLETLNVGPSIVNSLGIPTEVPWQFGMWAEVLRVISQNENVREIKTDELNYSMPRVLGQGRYGIVEEWIVRGEPELRVAVKQVKPNATGNYFAAIGEELKILSILGQHANIVELIGFYKGNLELGQLYLVMGICDKGSLKEYMTKKVQEANVPTPGESYCKLNFSWSPLPLTSPIPVTMLLKWGYEIACGLDHLGSKMVVHIDLAARNILLDLNLVCKIGDFGLSRKLDARTEEYSRTTVMNPISYKWMALESLATSCFTLQSDVWSYGVTLWEIFCVGKLEPYPHIGDYRELITRLSSPINYRLPKPIYSSDEIYALMHKCWHPNPLERPRCSQLKQFFSPYQIIDANAVREIG